MGVSEFDIVKANHFIGDSNTGQVYFVNNSTSGLKPGAIGGSDGNDGTSPERPFSTIDYAIGRCADNRGDIIYVMPGHNETITSAITCDVAGVSIIGLGDAASRPQITCASDIDEITITAANVTIENILFNENTSSPTSFINIGASGAIIRSCQFDCGANDLEAVTIEAAGDDALIIDNKFIITANGPDAAIEVESLSVDNLHVVSNFFMGDSNTNKWDFGAINSGVAHTNCLIKGNVFVYGTGINFTSTATGLICENLGGEPYVIGSCEYIAGGASGGDVKIVTADSTGGSGGTTETSTGKFIYVHSGTGSNNNDGSSPSTPIDNLDGAIGLCTASKKDTIVLMPGHSEDVTTQIDADVVGITIVGVGNGSAMPTLKNSFTSGTAATLRIDASGVEISGVKFDAGDTANTIGAIEIVDTTADTYIHDCLITQGTNDVQGITFLGTATRPVIKNNTFIVSANGPDEAIVAVAGALTGLIVEGNLFDGGSTTNSWDDSAISSDQANTSVYIAGNSFLHVVASKDAIVMSSTSASGLIFDNYVDNTSASFGIAAPTVQKLNNRLSITTDMELQTGLPQTTGKYIYVDSGTGADANDGLSPMSAKATIAGGEAIATANAGDVLVIMPGHAEAPTAVTTIDVAGLKVIALGEGADRATITPNAAGGAFIVLTIGASNVTLKGLRFAAESSGANITSQLNIATGVNNVLIEGCEFIQGANDPISVIFAGTSADTIIKNNKWRITANGPVDGITGTAGALTSCQIIGNLFDGGSVTNSWDTGAIVSDQNNVNLVIKNNAFLHQATNVDAIVLTSTTGTGLIEGNSIIGNSAGYGIAAPITAKGDNFLQNTTDMSVKSGLPVTTGKYIFVDSGTGADTNDGLSPMSAKATVAGAEAIATDNAGDVIIVFPGHAEAPTAVTTINIAGLTIVGLGNSENKPSIAADATGGAFNVWSIEADNVVIDNIKFSPATVAAITTQLNIANNLTGIVVKNCLFRQGANDPDSIIFAGSAVRPVIEDNKWVITANGPNYAIRNAAGVMTDPVIQRNVFDGDNTTDSWDDGVIYSDQACTSFVVAKNIFLNSLATQDVINISSTTATGIILDNYIDNTTDEYGIAAPTLRKLNNKFGRTSGMELQTGLAKTTGNYIYVDSGTGNNANDGLSPASAKATLAGAEAIATANNNDVIVLFPGHAETPTAVTTLNTAGLTVIGLGTGLNRPTFTPNAVGGPFNVISVEANNVHLENLYFAPESSGNPITAQLNVATGTVRLQVVGCTFDQGANDPDSILFAGTASVPLIKDCEWHITADGPNYAIYAAAGVLTAPMFYNNIFEGGSIANSWDNGIIFSDQANTSILISNNKFLSCAASVDAITMSSASALGIISDNYIDNNTDEYGIAAPSVAMFGNKFKRIAGLDVQGSLPLTTGKYIYVDSATGNNANNGLSPISAKATIAGAIAVATANAGDVIVVFPGHTEAPTATTTLNVIGVKILGLGQGTNRPTFAPDAIGGAFETLTVSANNVCIDNLRIAAAAGAANTSQIGVATGVNDLTVQNCEFLQGANDPASILFAGTATNTVIKNNKWRITADGPTTAISAIAGVLTSPLIEKNIFDGGSIANAWDTAAINSDQVNVSAQILDNLLLHVAAAGEAIVMSSVTATGTAARNIITGNASGGGINAPNFELIDNKLSDSSGFELLGTVDPTVGKYIFVDSVTGADTNNGLSPGTAMATLDAAIGLCTAFAGDIIIVSANHTESVTVQIDADVSGIKIVGLGTSNNRPWISSNFAAGVNATLRIDADDVEVSNIIFTEALTVNTIGAIEIVANASNFYLHDCVFYLGANDTQGITFLGATTRARIENNRFYVTADGPDEAILSVVGAQTSLNIKNNLFDGSGVPNCWDDGAIRSDQNDVSLLVEGNTFLYSAVNRHNIIFSGSATGLIKDNTITANFAGYGVNAPGVVQMNNKLYNLTANEASGKIDTTGQILFVDSNYGSAAALATHPSNAWNTLADAIGSLTAANTGATIYVMPGHAEDVAAQIDVNNAGLKIIGLGTRDTRPRFKNSIAVADQTLLVNAADVVIENLEFIQCDTALTPGNIAIAGTGEQCTIKNCSFFQGANDLYAIEVEAAVGELFIEDCLFYVTADGPTHAIYIGTAAVTQLIVKGCTFDGGSTASAWDVAAIWSDRACTAVEIAGNAFLYAPATQYHVEFTAAATGIIHDNVSVGVTEGYFCDPGSINLCNNFESRDGSTDEAAIDFKKYRVRSGVVLVDNSGATTPQAVFTFVGNTGQLEIVSCWLDLRTAAHLQNGHAYLDRGDGVDMQVGAFVAGGNDDGILINGPVAFDGALVVKYAADVLEAGALNIGYRCLYR